jgi:hypothetical protein
MNKISFYGFVTTMAMFLFVLTSCDQEFSEIGSGIVDDDHFAFLPDDTSTVKAFSVGTDAVQSNNLPINSLGIYNNPFFGSVKANFVTQLELASPNPVFDTAKNPVLDSVVLTIPYFSTRVPGNAGTSVYRLDSIRGSGAIDLKVFESGYVLNDLSTDPADNFQTSQRYYTNQDATFDSNKKGTLLNNSIDPTQNSAFNPNSDASKKEFVTLKLDRGLNPIVPKQVETSLSPRIRLKLDKAFFEQKIMNAPAGKLFNNSVFKDYFRGIYFQVQDATTGTMMQLDFSKGDITLHYREYAKLLPSGEPEKHEASDKDTYGGTPKLTARTLVLNMKGNTVNLLETQKSDLYSMALANSNFTAGDANLYLKGGEGSIAVIDLFGPDNFGEDGVTGMPDGVADELNIIRKKGWLINEANLTFFVNRSKLGAVAEPQRVYLYDLTNKRPLVDWSNDQSGTNASPKNIKLIYDGIVQKESNFGVKYRIRITNHIRNLIRKDSTNVRLGLSVTEAISLSTNVRLKTAKPLPDALSQSPVFLLDRIPGASLVHPLGTILYGSNIPAGSPDYDKRVKLEIYYTKPN